ncbi:PREDICTED: E3 ubiquitin-protein ligase Topors [Nelumbo nucifera]|uniref:RING-type E3 ubiquitin transferase n=2 Tax=Nelumbo nucifera TaxID=4432 RepID=A0A822YXY0_NELNU|nr:PREDICTED: E3 ubiquitin-protein ligase Topors [Nelumbo nucifera]DAD34108.1 TPA_asm: hypothetical protein HUJ06_004748 [Nelumbo nucifera]
MEGSSREKLLRKRIASAVREKSCPICLNPVEDRRAAVLSGCMHAYCTDCIRRWSQFKRTCPLCNSNFSSWFSKIRVSSGSFQVERLRDLDRNREGHLRGVRGRSVFRRRDTERFNTRRGQLPWRRRFGRSGSVGSDVVAERVLRWRASIYDRRLRAVPLPSQGQNITGYAYSKERMQQRVEPWIRRELQAVLGDSDPSIIVHLATFLWLASLEDKLKSPQECLGVDEFVKQLRPFLYDRTDMFWHELRCFAECSYTMETYDCLVEYERFRESHLAEVCM